MTSLTEFFSLVLLRLVFTAQNMPEYEFSLTRIFVSGQNLWFCPYTGEYDLFCTPWKRQKTFSDVFRGYRSDHILPHKDRIIDYVHTRKCGSEKIRILSYFPQILCCSCDYFKLLEVFNSTHGFDIIFPCCNGNKASKGKENNYVNM